MRIAIICTVRDGGMVHFAQSCYLALAELGHEALIILPEGAAADTVALGRSGAVRSYHLAAGLGKGRSAARAIDAELAEFSPDSVWLTDETVTSAAVRSMRANTVVFVHDVKPHLAKMRLKTRLRFAYLLGTRGRALGQASRVVVMSNSAAADLASRYGRSVAGKVSVLRLGATAPDCDAAVPPEAVGRVADGFFLFFGAIEKYKNVEGLVRAFTALLCDRPEARLVIAGRGAVEDEALNAISSHRGSILFLNRYIADGELVYLMRHARATVLPYLEATQSGVLPISYSFGKPVITSSAPGLSEFVVDGETGFVADGDDELERAMAELLDDALASRMGANGRAYAASELDFKANVAKVVSDLAATAGGSDRGVA